MTANGRRGTVAEPPADMMAAMPAPEPFDGDEHTRTRALLAELGTAMIATGQRHDIRVTRKVPVAWIYLTAWMTKDQTVQFRNDVYDQDEQLLEATAEEAAFFSQAGAHPLTAHLSQ